MLTCSLTYIGGVPSELLGARALQAVVLLTAAAAAALQGIAEEASGAAAVAEVWREAEATRVAEEGPAGLWRGGGPTVTRAMIVTAAQLATYEEAKEARVARAGADPAAVRRIGQWILAATRIMTR